MTPPLPAITRALNADPFASIVPFQGRDLLRAEARAIERAVFRFRLDKLRSA